MTDRQWEPTDEELVEVLKESFEAYAPVPQNMIDMIMLAYDITNIDAHLAELAEDTDVGEPVGVRSVAIGARLLTFEYGDLAFEFEIRPNPPHVVGHLEPARSGNLFLDQLGHAESVELDELGQFEFSLSSGAAFRLRLAQKDGKPIVTGWIIP